MEDVSSTRNHDLCPKLWRSWQKCSCYVFKLGGLWAMSSSILLCCHSCDLCASFAAALLFKMVRRSNSSTPEGLSKVLKTFLLNGIGDIFAAKS